MFSNGGFFPGPWPFFWTEPEAVSSTRSAASSMLRMAVSKSDSSKTWGKRKGRPPGGGVEGVPMGTLFWCEFFPTGHGGENYIMYQFILKRYIASAK